MSCRGDNPVRSLMRRPALNSGAPIEVKPRGLSHSCDSGRGLRYHRCRRPGLNLYYVPANYIIGSGSERYAKNAGAVFSLKYHLVWCPKYRRPVLVKAVDRRLKALLQ